MSLLRDAHRGHPIGVYASPFVDRATIEFAPIGSRRRADLVGDALTVEATKAAPQP